jgi:hypothetical protein
VNLFRFLLVVAGVVTAVACTPPTEAPSPAPGKPEFVLFYTEF